MECDFDPASSRQTNEYAIGLSALKRQEQRDEVDCTRWQPLFDEISRYWGKVCLRGESALRINGIHQTQLKITSVDIGVKLDGQGVKDLTLKDLTDSEKSLLIQWLCDNCSTMSAEKGGACTRAAVQLINEGFRSTMLPRGSCILHLHDIVYTSGRKCLVGTSYPSKRGFKKELHLDLYFKNLEYWCDKDWDSTKCIMKGLGYVKLPPWRKRTQPVHNVLSSDELKPGKKKQKQISSYPCLREKAKKAKTNRWLFSHMAAVSAKKHDFIDLMYCLMRCTKIYYTDDDPNGLPEDRWIARVCGSASTSNPFRLGMSGGGVAHLCLS